MAVLKFAPTVCAVGDEYEILVVTEKNGIIGVNVWGKQYYEENSGVLPSEKNYAKIRVPQSTMNAARHYCVTFREAINRKGYFSEIGETEIVKIVFKPITKTSEIKVYHVADVHYNYEIALKTAKYFGEETDLYIFNGDLGEVETIENYMETLKFMGDLTGGNIPVLFARGNHDTRGKLAEKFTDFYPSEGKNTYYKFSIGCLEGVILDCGEDKKDDHTDYNYPNPKVYNGVNVFSDYRRKELDWLQKTNLSDDKIKFAVSHICPVMASSKKGDCFDIEKECYTLWNNELERMGIDFMVCGHYHNAWILDKNHPKNIISHNYPVVIGSKITGERYVGGKVTPAAFYGAGMIISPDKIEVVFSDQNHEVLEKHTLKLKGKK